MIARLISLLYETDPATVAVTVLLVVAGIAGSVYFFRGVKQAIDNANEIGGKR